MPTSRKIAERQNGTSKKLAAKELVRMRSEIAALDRTFLIQFKKYLIARGKISQCIGRIKLGHKIKIRDAIVENAVIARFQRVLDGQLSSKAITAIAAAIVGESRRIQKGDKR